MDLYQHQCTKYDVPLNHLDHNYIRQCNDASEIEKIIKILRSKEEGNFPDLERLAEERLSDLKPKSKLLWKPSKLLSHKDLEEGERLTIEGEIQEWEESMKDADRDLNSKTPDIHFDKFPPVRGTSAVNNDAKSENKETSSSKANRRVKPRDYAEWDKLDVEAELKKVDNDKKNKSNRKEADNVRRLEELVPDADVPDPMKSVKAEMEKNKGNEAFKAKDYDEALSYYSRSLSVMETAPAYNNRAQIYLNQQKWDLAIGDCNSVMRLDPCNVKAHMRRSVAYQGLNELVSAQKDLKFVLEKEPTNKQAMDVMRKVEKSLADQKIHGRRLKIEEVEGTEDEEEGGDDDDDDKGDNSARRVADDSSSDDSTNGEGRIENSAGDAGNHFASKDDGVPCHGDDDDDDDIVTTSPAMEQMIPKSSIASTNIPSSEKSSSAPSSSSSLPHLEKLIPLQSKADELFRVGQYWEASCAYGKALEIIGDTPRSPQQLEIFESLLLLKSESDLKSGNIAASVEDCNAILKINPSSNEAYIRKAMALEEKENYREAYVCYKVVLDADSNNVVARRAIDRCASVLKNLFGLDWRSKLPHPPANHVTPVVTSEACTSTSIDASSSSPPLQSSSSSSLVHEMSEAIEKDCETSIPSVDEKPVPASSAPPSAVASSSSPLPSQSSSAPAASSASKRPFDECGDVICDGLYERFKYKGNKLFAQGEFSEAIECFAKCMDFKSDQVAPYTNRALCYLKLNQFDLALEDCNQALTIDFHCTKALYRRALAFKMKEEFDKSLIDLETLLKIDPGNSAAKKEINNINNTLKQMKEKKLMEACKRQEMKSRQRINIIDVDAEPNKCLKEEKTPQSKTPKKSPMPTIATVTKTTTTRSVRPTPCFTKVTSPYEFMQAYNSAKFADDDLSAYVALFDALDPSNLPKVLSNKLDCDMLNVIIRCLTFYLETGKKERASDYLESLMRVERFDMIVMFLSDDDKHEVNKMIEKASEDLDREFVNLLKLKFRV